ncbi:DUF5691 domain-containing protein [Hymenobacter actinosclerus]|uniref:SWIM-type domain-containing protein n=1 Tax=Hymenobacter actinosclerus TaxID=82805 RepID=A0A1I0DX06_9BACT|nr:DUF5691 domain-containing protein [Hymenobacter actinosclerus]SET37237.1 hypothetical protein SAMN04487998_1604 [Hymenobacter actinosclerus]
MISYSEDQARAFVTDAGTLQRGQQLAQATKWGNLGRTDSTAWGECAGSGAKPYLTGIDLTEPAFKCSCPSRVFPCKHGAGLLLLLARQPDTFTGNVPPAWLMEWLEKRQQTQEKKVEKAAAPKAPKPAAAPDAPETEAPEAEAAAGPGVDARRLARMETGAADLAAWLEDLLRAGLATLDQQPPKFWENQAARLVDNQLPGLAATVRELATVRHSYAHHWPARLLGRLGELYLLVRAFQNLPGLSAEARLEVLQLVGISLKKEALLTTTTPVADEWLVLGQFSWEEDRLTARRSWLHGRASGRLALVLEFAFGGQAFATALLPRASYRGELVFYPGLLPLRAAPVGLAYHGAAPPAAQPGLAGQHIAQLLEGYADALARQPWLREWPAVLTDVVLGPQPDGGWLLTHPAEDAALPLRFADEDAPWLLLAESGGQPLTLFGEWDGQAFRVLDTLPANLPITAPAPPHDATAPASSETQGLPSTPENAQPDQPINAAAPPERGLGAEALLRIALLGTRQSSEPLPPFPTPADTREQQLLLAAGTLALLQKAGFQPPTALVPPPAPAAAETRVPLGPLGADSLRQLLSQGELQPLLPDYLVRVGEAGRRVPAAGLVPLLHLAARSTDVAAALGPALGQRGRWLAALHPSWSRLLQKHVAPETVAAHDLGPWETGTLPERLAWLEQRLGQDADAARALLLAALPTEPAKVQQPLLELLADHLPATTEPALEKVLENLLRARGQEVRRLASELLVRLPGAALPKRLWARAAPLLSVRRKLPGLGAASLEVTLPTDWDKTWLLDGIEEKNARFLSVRGPGFTTPIGPATARLANLLTLLPPGRWSAHLGLPPAELLAAALASEWAQPLLPAWAESTLLHYDADFAAAFLHLWFTQRPALKKAQLDRSLNWAELAALLPAATRQQLVLQPVLDRVRRREGNWPEDISFVPAPWPRPLSAAVLAVVADKLANTAAPDQPGHPNQSDHVPMRSRQLAWLLPETVAAHLAPADVAWAIAQVEAIPRVNSAFQPALQEFTDLLRFQAGLEASLRE